VREVYILGVGMTCFDRHVARSIKSLAAEAVRGALDDAAIGREAVRAAFVGNAVQGIMTGQECIRGQVALREAGIEEIAIVNVENACASGSTALHLAWQTVAGGFHDCVLALGMEKLHHPERSRTLAALAGAVDVELLTGLREALAAAPRGGEGARDGAGERSLFMELYAAAARRHMALHGTRVEHFAAVAAKNASTGSLNPRAQYRKARTVEEVLASPVVAAPLTRLMCSPIGDGAAAAIVVSEDFVERLAGRGADGGRSASPPPSSRVAGPGRKGSRASSRGWLDAPTSRPGSGPATSGSPRCTTPPRPPS
jgi:acetyl-CoA acetyltransferase